MPTVLRIEGFRFFFYSKEGNEPAHVHVEHQANRAKFWLSPVSLAWNDGFNSSTLTQLYAMVRANQTMFLERWNEHFAQ
jgi:Domain of unknown function (DUF4160)